MDNLKFSEYTKKLQMWKLVLLDVDIRYEIIIFNDLQYIEVAQILNIPDPVKFLSRNWQHTIAYAMQYDPKIHVFYQNIHNSIFTVNQFE